MLSRNVINCVIVSYATHALPHVVTHEAEEVLPGALVLFCPHGLQVGLDGCDELRAH